MLVVKSTALPEALPAVADFLGLPEPPPDLSSPSDVSSSQDDLQGRGGRGGGLEGVRLGRKATAAGAEAHGGTCRPEKTEELLDVSARTLEFARARACLRARDPPLCVLPRACTPDSEPLSLPLSLPLAPAPRSRRTEWSVGGWMGG